MIYIILKTLALIFLALILSVGVYVISLWSYKNMNGCCKRKQRWVCEHCGEIEKSHKQPFCKPCCHIHRGNVKMVKIKK